MRKVRGARDARACLAAVAESGLSRREWARSNGVNARSLNAWRLNLARSEDGEVQGGPPDLVEWVPSGPRPSSRYRVLCGELAIEVEADFDAAVLRRLLDVVAGC